MWVDKLLSKNIFYQRRGLDKRLQRNDVLVMRPATAPPTSGGTSTSLTTAAPDDQFSRKEKQIVSVFNTMITDPQGFASRIHREYEFKIRNKQITLQSAEHDLQAENCKLQALQQQKTETEEKLEALIKEKNSYVPPPKHSKEPPRNEALAEDISACQLSLAALEQQLHHLMESITAWEQGLSKPNALLRELKQQKGKRSPLKYSRGLSLVARLCCINPSEVTSKKYGASIGDIIDSTMTFDQTKYDNSPFGMVARLALNPSWLNEMFGSQTLNVVGCGWRRHPHRAHNVTVSILAAVAFLDSSYVRQRAHLPLQSVGHQVSTHFKEKATTLPIVFTSNSVTAVTPTEHPIVCGNSSFVTLNVCKHHEVTACISEVVAYSLTEKPPTRAITDQNVFFQPSSCGSLVAHFNFPKPGRHCVHIFSRKKTNSSTFFGDIVFKPVGTIFFTVEPSLWKISKMSTFVRTMPVMEALGVVINSPIKGSLKKGKLYEFSIEIMGPSLSNRIQVVRKELIKSVGPDVLSDDSSSSASSLSSRSWCSSRSVETASHSQELQHLCKQQNRQQTVTLESSTKCMQIPLENGSSTKYLRRVLVDEPGELLLITNDTLIATWEVVK
eukprot:TRINITY_DN37355_c0_g1_i1.p1 TRINITY_DN37355_c0_g1~~TRINITY_DN37355_c0_g1_i1.p1  ORF type:complete len:648 (+),score=100.20 TRINITY_DN37355_c0_g1_i1:106-1944(+)